MKQKNIPIRNLRIFWKIVHQSVPWAPVVVVLSVFVATVLPIAELRLLSHLLEGSTQGQEVGPMLQSLFVDGMLVFLVAILSVVFSVWIKILGEKMRLTGLQDVLDTQLQRDFPLIQGEEASKRYLTVAQLFDHAQTSLSRILTEWQSVLHALVALVVYAGILLQVEWGMLFLVGLFLMGFIVCEVRYVRERNERYPEMVDVDQKLTALRYVIGDNRFAKDIRLYTMGEWLTTIFQQLKHSLPRIHRPLNRLQLQRDLLAVIAIVCISGITYWRSFQLIQQGEITISQFVVYVGLSSLIATLMMDLVHQLSRVVISLQEAEAYRKFYDVDPVFPITSTAPVPETINTITFNDITYTYPGQTHPSIDHISVTIQKGERIAIVGLNGAGKTTLMKLLMGLILPDRGEILLNGISIRQFSPKDYYPLFAPLFQDVQLTTFTIEETILQQQERNETHYQQVLQESGMAAIVNGLPEGDQTKILREIFPDAVTLSGGQLQRLKLAQALYKDSPVYIFDEPTAALDPIAEREVYHQYEQFSRGKISFFISHRLASTHFCDRIFYMENGKIIEEGSHTTLIEQNGAYANLYHTQAHYYKEGEHHEKSAC